jgi:hypothetical protein
LLVIKSTSQKSLQQQQQQEPQLQRQQAAQQQSVTPIQPQSSRPAQQQPPPPVVQKTSQPVTRPQGSTLDVVRALKEFGAQRAEMQEVMMELTRYVLQHNTGFFESRFSMCCERILTSCCML